MCEEHARLLKLYQEAVATFSASLTALDLARPKSSTDEYARMVGYVDQARHSSEEARAALQQHTSEHGCFPSFAADAQVTTA